MKLIIIGILLSFNVIAGNYFPKPTSQDQPWSVSASAGAGSYQVNSSDKSTAIGRLALANELMLAGNIALGLELGLQTGTRIKLDMQRETFQALRKWIPMQTTLSPTLDLLITTKSDPLGNSDFFAQLKGGLAYRHWRDARVPLNDISQLAGEIQAGFGYPITALASLSLLYQGIFSGNGPNLHLDTRAQKEQLSNIPTLHAILVGLSVNL
ncbi:hypothetical protein [Legionella longbeachae]|uniref:Outer membrane protein beta-barrel domain-containing protein n=1 Tax=Legionella longbeachae serogroup 1 (strain NSW150) TaxID=661367 RepID=D3HKC0_LEGLN|nr:hypothetical protein [Legionella longbeachae]VEE03400.1 Uncharacterised protein [Legionella oakridgensis]HBD7397676.1 hypothetical protein [Legionella pneumophila]ARB93706.1 hypothetical protein A6J40_16660 [Legionella longbeachae]ARM33154.1 hypothetical protein B0B39_06305 [Legionella longbeachae]EEZ93997.1 conserved hypothetical protein [Legionella longbeachae D-4968]